MKRICFSLFTAVLFALLLSFSCYAEEVKSFSDLPEDHWAYPTVMEMVQKGLFNGTSTPVDGVGTFSPDKAMTRGEFLAVICRIYYPDEIYTPSADLPWWDPYYTIAIKHDLVSVRNDFLDCNVLMNRAEAVMVLCRALEDVGKPLTYKHFGNIPDEYEILRYNTTNEMEYDNSSFLEMVRNCMGEGIISGVDGKGTFDSYGNLTRAAAATIICRAYDETKRFPKKDYTDVIPCTSNGHRYTTNSEYELIVPATETEYGITHIYCTVCGQPKEIYFHPHEHSEGNKITRYSCGSKNYAEVFCRVQESIIVDNYEYYYYIDCRQPMRSTYDFHTGTREEAIHTYGEWEIISLPERGVDGRMEKVCTKCGDKYIKIIPMYSTEGTTLDIRNSYGLGHISGYLDHLNEYHSSKMRRTYDPSQNLSLSAIESKLNGFVGVRYGDRFFDDGISTNYADKGRIAKLVRSEDGKDGINVFGWRKSYETIFGSGYNMVMEAIYLLTGDREVAYALWHVIDFQSINGSAATTAEKIESFGFKVSNETENSVDLEMKNTKIFWVWNNGINKNTFYFDRIEK